MTESPLTEEEVRFHSFVDGHLAPEERRSVMTTLAANPERAAQLGEYQHLNEAIHLLYDEVLHEPLPERLKIERYVSQVTWRMRVERWLSFGGHQLTPRIAGLAALMLASGVAGWSMNSWYHTVEPETPAMSFARQAANAHNLYAADGNHPVEFGAEQQELMLSRLSERLGHPVYAPVLHDIGFELVRGRLLPSAGLPAAQLIYMSPEGSSITLYIRAGWDVPPSVSTQEGAVSYGSAGTDSMVYWVDGALAYALTGHMAREALFRVADLIQQQLRLPVLPSPAVEQSADKDAT